MKKLFSLLILLSVFFQNSFAAEIDSVTRRNLDLDNSLASINTIFEQRMQEGIEKANEKQGDIEYIGKNEFCNEEILYTELRKAIFQSFTASWGLKGYDLDKQLRVLLANQSFSLPLNDSIYRDINYLEGFSLNLKGLSDVVNINDHLIGLDKMGHFFSEGWQYFELTQYKEQNIGQALKWGEEQETGNFGYTTTGIYSFADLVANFNGWRFWNKVLLKERDPLKGILSSFFNKPYITCEIQTIDSIKNKRIVKAWEENTRFDLLEYVDGAWDEGNNGNNYEDPVIEEKVSSRINNVDSDFTYPVLAKECLTAQVKYGYYAKYVLHPSCLSATKD